VLVDVRGSNRLARFEIFLAD